jgi:hypothetical protein
MWKNLLHLRRVVVVKPIFKISTRNMMTEEVDLKELQPEYKSLAEGVLSHNRSSLSRAITLGSKHREFFFFK